MQKLPFVSITWITRTAGKSAIADMALEHKSTYRFSQDQKLQKRLKTEDVMQALFAGPRIDPAVPLKGHINW